MVDQTQLSTQAVEEMDFLAMLEESLAVEQPVRGDIVMGTVLAMDNMGLLVGLGMKRDGVVPRSDLERLGDEAVQFAVGDEIRVMIIRTEDADGNMIVSVSQAKQSEDWLRAEELMDNGGVWDGVVADANRGGLIVPFGNLRGFVPASHVLDLPRGMSEDERTGHLNTLIGRPITVKIIEVNRRRRRLVLSQREAQREIRDASKDELLGALKEGDIRHGVVSGLRDFGAFVDLGGADGLIHISELAWHRVKHPREVLNVGDEIEVFVLRLDLEGRRIGLSLKRLQPNPWSQVDEIYYVGQTVEGTISRVTQFGAFVSLDPGIEALLHASQMSDPAPADPTLLLHEGQVITARIISIEPHRQRLGLSIRDIDNGLDFETEEDEAEFSESDAEEVVAELPESDVEEVVAEFSESDVEVEVVAELAQSEIEAGASDEDTVESAVVEPPLAEEM